MSFLNIWRTLNTFRVQIFGQYLAISILKVRVKPISGSLLRMEVVRQWVRVDMGVQFRANTSQLLTRGNNLSHSSKQPSYWRRVCEWGSSNGVGWMVEMKGVERKGLLRQEEMKGFGGV